VAESWDKIMRWSRIADQAEAREEDVLGQTRKVGPGRYWSAPHQTHFDPSFLEFSGIL